jgi:ubiquinone biosynthesis monooxygenase Coq6
MLAAVDKLHKLYSSTFEPVVWARSVGLEVINELDAVKAALMISAGSGTEMRSAGWNLAAGGVERMDSAVKGVKVLGQGLITMVGVGLQELGKKMSSNQK